MIWSVPRAWPGETCFILAGGPSLRGFDAEQLRGRGRVIAINDSWRLAPWADVLYFCDAAWWDEQTARNYRSVDESITFHDLMDSGFWMTGSVNFPDHPQVRQMRLTGQTGLEADSRGLRHGNNAGYQAINLAAHFGVSTIVLLGYDMKVGNGGTHWHAAPRPDGFARIIEDSFLPLFETLVEPLQAADIEVLNATPDSALDCWPRVSLDQILALRTSELTPGGQLNGIKHFD